MEKGKKMTKRQHSTKVKATIAIEAIKGEKTIAEISRLQGERI
jgi:transposase-like protein